MHLQSEDPAHALRLKTNGHKIFVSDELLEFLAEKEWRYRVEVNG